MSAELIIAVCIIFAAFGRSSQVFNHVINVP